MGNTMRRVALGVILGLFAVTLARGQSAPNCNVVAPLPPMATFGGR
jgi:hypothetical protein